MQKPQIIFIDWWNIFKNDEVYFQRIKKREYQPERETRQKRHNQIYEKLKEKYNVFRPEMPNRKNAKYKLRKLRFEKVLKKANIENLTLIGHSLWGMFLIKYLWENWFPKKIKQLHLVSAVLDNTDMPEEEKYLGDFEYNPKIIPNLEKYCENIFIYHSKDDPIIPYSHGEKIKSYLPKAKFLRFENKWHFNIPRFPELLKNIK